MVGSKRLNILAIIVDYQSEEDARKLSLEIVALQYAELSLDTIVVDNGNSSPRILNVQQVNAGVQLLRSPDNDGYAGGLRFAIAQGPARLGKKYDAYWFLNADLSVPANCLPKLARILKIRSRVGAVAPVIYWGETARVWGARGVVSPWLGTTAMTPWPSGGVLPRWSYLPGACLLVRKSAYDDAGGMPERYRMYYEEAELCVCLQKKGWDLFVEADAKARHFVASQAGRIPARHFAFYFARNNLFFWKNNFRIPAWVQFPRTVFVVFKELIFPLRRAPSWRIFNERLGDVWGGLIDGFEFLRKRYTKHEKRIFFLDQDRTE